MNSPIQPTHCMLDPLFHAVWRISLDSWALGCPCRRNILFHGKADQFFYNEPTASLRGTPELHS